MKTAKRNQSVEKMLTIVETMACARGPMRLLEIAQAVDLPASTTLRFLVTLMGRDYAVQDRDTLRYSLTLRFCQIADLVKSQVSIRDVARPYLVGLAEKCGESTCLAMEQDRTVVYMDAVEGPDSMLRTLQRIGRRAPLHSTGVGKVLLAGWPPDAVARLSEEVGLEPLTPHTITTLESLQAELGRVREAGFAIDDEECEVGVRCIAVPVSDFTGRVVASVSVTGPATRMTDAKIDAVRGLLLESAGEISRALGSRNGCALADTASGQEAGDV
jgi:DNA-binding IclR family transcriptional regulator